MLDPEWVALRSVEINRCFLRNPNEQHAYLHFPEIMKTGQTIRLANMFRMRETIPFKQARGLSSLLNLQPATFDSIIAFFESLGWIYPRRKNGEITTLDENIPLTQTVLNQMGKLGSSPEKELKWIRGISPIEFGALTSLNMCSRIPCSLNAISSATEIVDERFDLMMRLGQAGKYLDVQTLPDGKVAFSPLYYFNRYDEIQKKLKRQTVASLEPVREILEQTAKYVGQPLEILSRPHQNLANSGIQTGWLIPSHLDFPDKQGIKKYTFLYPPLIQFEDSIPSGDIFEKAKILISSLRLGEHYAPTSKIKNPNQILNKLLRDKKLGRPHSDAFDQYKLAASKGLFSLKWESGISFYGNEYEAWMPYLINSEENMKIVQTAIDLLEKRSEMATDTLKNDIESADNILKNTASVYESLEFRGSAYGASIKIDPELEKLAYKLSLTISGGTYE